MEIFRSRQEQMDLAYIKRQTGQHVQKHSDDQAYYIWVAQYNCWKHRIHWGRWVPGTSYRDALHNAAQHVKNDRIACGCD